MLANWIVTAFVGLAAAAPALWRRAPSLPTLDPFYDQPSNISDYTAGEIIRYRPTPSPIGAGLNLSTINIDSAYQIMFRTQSAIGDPTAAVTTVLVPHNAKYDKLLSYQAAYDSSDPNCSPSYTLQRSSNETSYDPLFIAVLLNQGWVVTTPDYEGLQADFVAGLTAGYATLDAVRATLASEAITGVISKATTGLWGYSGGALASEWALEVQPQYAPELTFAGAALGGLTPNATNVITDINTKVSGNLIFSGINGLSRAYPNLTEYISSVLIPSKAATFHSVNFACTNDTDATTNVEKQNIFSFFTSGEEILSAPVPASVLKWGATMGYRDTPRPPLYVYKAIHDEVSPIADTDALVAEYCRKGATIEYTRNPFGEHVSEALLGAFEAYGWIIDRMNGKPAPAGCSTTDVIVLPEDVETFDGFGDAVIAVLLDILGLPLGPTSFQGI